MKLLANIIQLIIKNTLALVVIISFIILVSFLPTAFVATSDQPKKPSAAPVPVENLLAHWTLTTESAVYLTVDAPEEAINYKFGAVSGYWDIDPQQPDQMKAEMAVTTDSLTSGNLFRDRTAKNEDHLHTEQFPDAKFQLKAVEKWPLSWGEGVPMPFHLKGTLTLKGKSQDVVFDVEAKYHKEQFRLKGTATINLQDFGIAPINGQEQGKLTLQWVMDSQTAKKA